MHDSHAVRAGQDQAGNPTHSRYESSDCRSQHAALIEEKMRAKKQETNNHHETIENLLQNVSQKQPSRERAAKLTSTVDEAYD